VLAHCDTSAKADDEPARLERVIAGFIGAPFSGTGCARWTAAYFRPKGFREMRW
jgi:hypothetical protein